MGSVTTTGNRTNRWTMLNRPRTRGVLNVFLSIAVSTTNYDNIVTSVQITAHYRFKLQKLFPVKPTFTIRVVQSFQ